jgi:hypothetical protein
MGGNAIKDPKTQKSICGRLSKDHYEMIKQHVLKILQSLTFICETVRELPGKDSFGDIDVLYVKKEDINMRDIIRKYFNVTDETHIAGNGNVMSFAFDCSSVCTDLPLKTYFQVDFIKVVNIEHLGTIRFYFSYGDIGAIFGRIFNYYSLKFGDMGLWCELVENTVDPSKKFNVKCSLGKVMLSYNIQEICNFAGIDYQFWDIEIPKLQKDQRDKIFNWIKSCPLFSPDIFKSLNSDHRHRFNLRPFYKEFVQSIGITDVTKVEDTVSETGGNAYNSQLKAIKYFKKENEMNAVVQMTLLRNSRKEKFSGGDFLEKYKKTHNVELDGKQSGEIVNNVKRYFLLETNSNIWDEFLDTHSKEENDELIEKFICSS